MPSDEKIKSDLKQAQLDKDETRVSTLRLLISELNNARIAKGQELLESDITSVVSREVKKRREAAEAFKNAGRTGSAQKEEAELSILRGYLPAQLPTEELTKLVEDSINEVGASSISDMGKVISLVMSKASGQAEGSEVSRLVKEKLSNG